MGLAYAEAGGSQLKIVARLGRLLIHHHAIFIIARGGHVCKVKVVLDSLSGLNC